MDRIHRIANFWKTLASLSNHLHDLGIAIIPRDFAGGAIVHANATINTAHDELEERHGNARSKLHDHYCDPDHPRSQAFERELKHIHEHYDTMLAQIEKDHTAACELLMHAKAERLLALSDKYLPDHPMTPLELEGPLARLELHLDQEQAILAKSQIPWGDSEVDQGFDYICLHLTLARNGEYLMSECPEYAQAGAIWEKLGGHWAGSDPSDCEPRAFWWHLTDLQAHDALVDHPLGGH